MKLKTVSVYLTLVTACLALSRQSLTLNVPIHITGHMPVYGPIAPTTVQSTAVITTNNAAITTNNAAITTNNVTSAIPTPVISAPVVTAPVVTAPVVTAPVVTAPVVTAPVVTAPVVTAPVVTAPVVTAPVVTAPVVTAPVVTAPVVTAPVVTAPVIPTPVISTPVVTAPVVTANNTAPIVTTNNAIVTLNTAPIVTTNNAIVTLNTLAVVTTNNIAPVITTNNAIVTLNTLPIVTTNNAIVTLNTVPIVTLNTAPIVTLNTAPVITTNNAIVTLNIAPIVTLNTAPVITTNNAIVTLNTLPIVTTNNAIVTLNIAPIVTLNKLPIVTTNNVAPVITTNNAVVTTNNAIVTTNNAIVTLNTLAVVTTNNIAPVITTNNANTPIKVIAVKISNIRSTVVITQQYTLIVEVDYSDGKVAFNPSDLVITQDSNHFTQNGATFTGARSGNAIITAADQGVSTSETIYVNPTEMVSLASLNQFLVTPAANARIIVPIVVINYIPTVDGINLDTTRAPQGGNSYGSMSIAQVKIRASDNQILTKYGIEEGSKFRNFNGTNSNAEVGLQVVGWYNVYEITTMMVPNQTVTATTDPIIDVRPIFANIGLQNYVNTMGVKEVWLNFYPISSEYQIVSQFGIPQSKWINFAESYMSSPTTGNISNSDCSNAVLPVYNSTYVVYGYNLARTYSDNMHNRGHQIEREMSYLDRSPGGGQYGQLYCNQFVGIPVTGGIPKGRVGETHFAPNSASDYDWQNTTPVATDIRNWAPGAGGKREMLNCDTWMNIMYNLPAQSTYDNSYIQGDSQFKWIMFLFQSIPGYNNNIPYNNTVLSDWWDLFYNWDAANTTNKTLWK